jgi:ATP citrate (pro-S)-lyase
VPLLKKQADRLDGRQKKLISVSVSYDQNDEVRVTGQDLLSLAQERSFAYIAVSMFLGRQIRSAETEAFVDMVFKLLVDHGPYVSGAVNTIVSARAGKDLVSSLASGLLTIGPRFGGAINEAAATWLKGVREAYEPAILVEEFAGAKKYISGIGHKKYRIDFPDPRVKAILAAASGLESHRFLTFAAAVEKVTVAKKGNLILNVDGAIAACLLDLLYEKERYSLDELQGLVDTEFFNGLFILSRSVGFMSHYFDQRRLDEGLFRLSPDQVMHIETPD